MKTTGSGVLTFGGSTLEEQSILEVSNDLNGICPKFDQTDQ